MSCTVQDVIWPTLYMGKKVSVIDRLSGDFLGIWRWRDQSENFDAICLQWGAQVRSIAHLTRKFITFPCDNFPQNMIISAHSKKIPSGGWSQRLWKMSKAS